MKPIPAWRSVKEQGNTCLAGPIDVINPNPEPEFPEYRLPPAKTREAFAQRAGARSSRFRRAIRFIAATNI